MPNVKLELEPAHVASFQQLSVTRFVVRGDLSEKDRQTASSLEVELALPNPVTRFWL